MFFALVFRGDLNNTNTLEEFKSANISGLTQAAAAKVACAQPQPKHNAFPLPL
tara:strand:+ start:191 stop:349 length:159 start_codon:yes stop_codon:yes gene_type:complete